MFEFLEKKLPYEIQGILYAYIHFAIILILVSPSIVLSAAYLILQIFLAIWNIKRKDVLQIAWIKLYKKMKRWINQKK